MTSSYYLQRIHTSDVPNVDDILAFPSMKDEENLKKLYLLCANGTDKYLHFDKNEYVFLQNLENMYSLSVSSYFLGDPQPIEPMEPIDDSESAYESESEKITPLENLYRFMKSGGIDFADYLFERSWFIHNHKLQEKVFRLIMQDRAHLLDVMAGDFEEHIDSLLL